MLFRDRAHAAELLVAELLRYAGQRPLVLAIPRGAVPMGRIIADGLGGDLDVVLVRKLRAPDQPELAIGAIDEDGKVYLAAHAQAPWISRDYLEQEQQRQLALLGERGRRYRSIHPPIDPSGRIAIVVDDGIATGSTMIAALTAVRAKAPSRLVVATAVAPSDVVERLRRHADEVVCLAQPEFFDAIGRFFRDFSQVSDDEVAAILEEARAPQSPRST